MSYDPFADDSEHVSIGPVQMRLGYVEHCLGIPAATLAQLRAGTHVVVPREPTEAMLDKGQHANSEWLNDNAPLGERRYREPAKAVYRAMLAAAQEPPRDE